MIALFTGCSRSKISVFPANWNTKKASLARPWMIHYRFYDPAFKDTPQWGKLVQIKGMNRYKTLEARQSATKILLDTEITQIDKLGHNPITGKYPDRSEAGSSQEISSSLPLITALREGMKRMDVSPDTMVDVVSTVNGVEKACEKLWDQAAAGSYLNIPVDGISRKHIKYILEQCGKDNEHWSEYRYNRYKDNLSMIFRVLKEFEVVEFNPTTEISKKEHIPESREVITDKEFELISESLLQRQYEFWRYTQIFHRSGSRTTEMLRLMNDNKIDLERQEFQVLVIKGKKKKWDIRPIHKSVLHLWKEIMAQAKPGEYLFSEGLKPGPTRIRKDQICRRWNRFVKAPPVDESKRKRKNQAGGLGINKDFYTLKHRNTDNIAKALDIRHAQVADGHETPVVTLRNYAVGEKQRELDRLKNW